MVCKNQCVFSFILKTQSMAIRSDVLGHQITWSEAFCVIWLNQKYWFKSRFRKIRTCLIIFVLIAYSSDNDSAGVVYYYFITVEETRTRNLVGAQSLCVFFFALALCLNVLAHKNTKPFSQQLQWLGTKRFIIAPKGWTIFSKRNTPAKPTKIRQNRFV